MGSTSLKTFLHHCDDCHSSKKTSILTFKIQKLFSNIENSGGKQTEDLVGLKVMWEVLEH